MAGPEKPILVDTNAIIEAHRVRGWRALAGSYQVETVEDCVTETQTGFQNRPPEQQIDVQALRSSLGEIHPVGNLERATLALRIQGISLDLGEESLWAHALGRNDRWLFCGPDKASLRAGVRLGFRNQIISLESLFDGIGHKPRVPLKDAYTKKWLRKTLSQLVLEETLDSA